MAELLNKIPTNLTEYPNSFKRQGAFPLEAYSVFYTMDAAETYAASNPIAYVGQTLAVVTANAEDATVVDNVTFYIIADAAGTLQEVGKATNGDGKTVKLNAEGKIELAGLDGLDANKTYVPSLVNGVLTWSEPDTSTAEGQQQAIDGLTSSVAGLSEIINGKAESAEGTGDAVVGLVDKVAALEAVDNATQAEFDAYKEVVTAAIAAGVKEAKDYADANDADTVYDDTALAARVKALEDEERYDETALANRVTANEEAIADLDEAIGDANGGLVKDIADEKARAEAAEAELLGKINAIDFVDADELADAIKDFATDSELEAGLALKADKTALEELAATVDAFLTGDGTEAALDSLKELIAYIDEHDGADLTELFATVQGIENKLTGIDSTVAAYVTAAVEALKIGDYAKAADLTALAGRVEILEAKPFDTYATKTEVQNVDAKFANYTTTETLTTQLAAKADADKVVANDTFETFKTENTSAIEAAQSAAVAAAKTETETQVGALEDVVAETYATKSELGEAVEDIETELLDYAKTADVNTELAKKIDKATISHSTDEKAESATVTGTQLDIVVDAFTKAETRQYVADTIKTMTGGESAADVKLLLENHVAAYTEKVGQIDAKDTAQDTAIAAAQAQADKGVADALAAQNTANGALSAITILTEGQVATNANDIATLTNIVTGEGGHASRIGALESYKTTHTGEFNTLKGRVDNNETEIAKKANADDVYTKSVVDGFLASKADAESVYTKSEVDAAILAAKPDLTPYAKTEDVDKTVETINKSIATKANAADVYTKTEIDNFAFLNESQVDARINALIAASDPDGDGNVITNIQNLVEYVENNAGEIAGLVTTVGSHTTAIAKNAEDIIAINNSIDDINDAIAAIVQPKASTEISVAADGKLGINEVNVNKLVQTAGDTLILNGGSASTTAAE